MYRASSDQDYFERALQEDISYNNKLIVSDLKFRADSGMNVVMSISDVVERTGTGKSSGGIKMSLNIANIFGSTFDLSHLTWTPEELDKKIETAPNNTVWQLDEQRRTQIGMMSNTIASRLGDAEDMLRQSKISIVYVAPQLREHNHFFILKTHQMIRVKNPLCQKCKNNCNECKLPFYERSGYPESIILMLSTKRFTTGMPVPRGLIRVSMPAPDLMKEYWALKEINVQKIKKKEESLWQDLKALATKIFEQKKDTLLHKKKKGGWAVAPKSQITIALYDIIGMRYLPNQTRELVEEQIKMMLENYAAEKDAKEEFETENKEDEEKEGDYN
jgi:hypothetical protein